MTAINPPRVLLVDDSDVMLDYASATLSPEYEIVGAFRDGHAALEAVGVLQPDVIVLDISMPGMNGLEVAGRLRRAGCSTPIVFLTVHDDEATVHATSEAGGIGFVLKPLLRSDLAVAVREACAGRRYVSQMG